MSVARQAQRTGALGQRNLNEAQIEERAGAPQEAIAAGICLYAMAKATNKSSIPRRLTVPHSIKAGLGWRWELHQELKRVRRRMRRPVRALQNRKKRCGPIAKPLCRCAAQSSQHPAFTLLKILHKYPAPQKMCVIIEGFGGNTEGPKAATSRKRLNKKV